MKKLNKNTIKQVISKISGITIDTLQENKNSFKVVIIVNSMGEVENAKFHLDYLIEINILVPKNYPRELPTCSEYGERKIDNYHHLFERDNSFCLGTNIELRDRLSPSYKLDSYINMIAEYLIIYEYYKKYNVMPVIERSHGKTGILEGYKFLLNVEDNIAVYRLIRSIPVKNKMRNKECPCGSSKTMKKCHFNQLSKLSNDPYFKKQVEQDSLAL